MPNQVLADLFLSRHGKVSANRIHLFLSPSSSNDSDFAANQRGLPNNTAELSPTKKVYLLKIEV